MRAVEPDQPHAPDARDAALPRVIDAGGVGRAALRGEARDPYIVRDAPCVPTAAPAQGS